MVSSVGSPAINIISKLKKGKQIMKTILIKITAVMAMLLLIVLSPAWSAETQSMMGTTTIPGGGSNTTTTMMGGGGMMGGSARMGQFAIADLDNDKVPEIVTIVGGRELVIMDNVGNIISSKPLPTIPGITNNRIMVSDLQVADMDGDGTPEIVTTYYVGNYVFMFGSSTSNGTYLVIMDNQGNLKDYKQLQLPTVY